MQSIDIMVVRIYTMEGSPIIPQIMQYLKNEAHVRGASTFRAISGFGDHGSHSSSILDWSMELPLVIEFFDLPEKISSIVEHLSRIVEAEHIIFFKAQSFSAISGSIND